MLLRSVLILSGITLVIYGQDSFRGQRPDCTLVDCGVPTGCAFEDTFIPKGQCCPVCRRDHGPDCRHVRCGAPPGCAIEDTFIPRGQCCPVCRKDHGPDCRLVRCGAPPSCAIEDTFIPRGQCCPVCRRRFDKPGRCPNVGSNIGICVSLCTGDADCPGRGKCCSNGCGHLCSRPVFGDWWPRCSNVVCPMLRCPYGLYTPPGQCCSVCRPPPPDEFPNCAAVLCLQAPCSRPITPPGQCCPVCPKGGDDN